MPASDWFTKPRLVAFAKFIAIAAAFTAIPFVAFRMPGAQAWVFAQAESMRDSGILGVAAYMLLCFVSGVLALPFWIPGVLAGFVFGFPNGGAIGFVGSVVSTIGAFVSGRLFLQRRVRNRLKDNTRWQKLEVAIRATPRKIVFLLRSLPVLPQNLLGYALATTPVSFFDYVIGAVGLLPLVIAYSYLGSLAHNVNELFRATSNSALFIVIGVMTFVVLIVSARFAARVLREILREQEG